MTEPLDSKGRLDRIAAPLLCALVFLVFADVLVFGQSLFVRDVASYYYPTKLLVRDVVLEGELPLWNRHYGAGQPMAANPEYAVFYPPHVLLLLPGYDFWFQVLIAFHVGLLAVGTYRLLRSLGQSELAAMFGSVAFAFGGLIGSLLNLLPYLFILAWLPWAYLFGRRWLHDGDRRALGLSALAFGMQILTAEPSTLVQVWLIAGFYTLFLMSDGAGSRPRSAVLARRLTTLFVSSVGVGLVQLLPAMDHVVDSVRSRPFSFDTVTSWSMPPFRLFELLVPGFFGKGWFGGEGGYWGSVFYAPRPLPFLLSVYCGIPVAVFALAAFIKGGRAMRWIGGGCAALFILALGDGTPLYRIAYDSGFGRSFRYPEKLAIGALILVVFVAASVFSRISEYRSLVSRIGLVVTIAGIAVGTGALVFLGTDAGMAFVLSEGGAVTPQGAALLAESLRVDWVVNVVRFGVYLGLFFALNRIEVRRWSAILIVVLFFDLTGAYRGVSPSIDREYFDEPAIASTLDSDRGAYRIFPLANWYQAYGLSPNGGKFSETGLGAYWTVRNGMAPMLVSAWGFQQALEIDYDRTLLTPTMLLLQAMWDVRSEVGGERDEVFAAMANARYITRFRDFDSEMERAGGDVSATVPVDYLEVPTNRRYYFADKIELARTTQDFIRSMIDRLPDKRVAFVDKDPFEPAGCSVLSVDERTNGATVEIDCSGRSLLVASVTPHKYWSASIDDETAPIRVVNVAYTGLDVPQGRHVVRFEYRNPVIVWSGVVSVVSILTMLGLAWTGGRRRQIG